MWKVQWRMLVEPFHNQIVPKIVRFLSNKAVLKHKSSWKLTKRRVFDRRTNSNNFHHTMSRKRSLVSSSEVVDHESNSRNSDNRTSLINSVLLINITNPKEKRKLFSAKHLKDVSLLIKSELEERVGENVEYRLTPTRAFTKLKQTGNALPDEFLTSFIGCKIKWELVRGDFYVLAVNLQPMYCVGFMTLMTQLGNWCNKHDLIGVFYDLIQRLGDGIRAPTLTLKPWGRRSTAHGESLVS